LPSAVWNWASSRPITRHSFIATAEALRGVWPIEAISPKISPAWMVGDVLVLGENTDPPLKEQVDPVGHEQQGHAFPVLGENRRALRDRLRLARGPEEIQRDRRIVVGRLLGLGPGQVLRRATGMSGRRPSSRSCARSFFARLTIPAESFFALSLFRRVVSILECVTWVRMVSVGSVEWPVV